MTIVCYDGKKLVADSQSTSGEMILPGHVQKIFEPEEGEYWEVMGVKVLAFGHSGAVTSVPYIKELLNQGLTHRSTLRAPIETSFGILFVLETGDCYVLNNGDILAMPEGDYLYQLRLFPGQLPVAAGCGLIYAYAAMGPKDKDQAIKGVETAKRLCPYCGGDTKVWELPPPPEVPSKRPVPISTDKEDPKPEDKA